MFLCACLFCSVLYSIATQQPNIPRRHAVTTQSLKARTQNLVHEINTVGTIPNLGIPFPHCRLPDDYDAQIEKANQCESELNASLFPFKLIVDNNCSVKTSNTDLVNGDTTRVINIQVLHNAVFNNKGPLVIDPALTDGANLWNKLWNPDEQKPTCVLRQNELFDQTQIPLLNTTRGLPVNRLLLRSDDDIGYGVHNTVNMFFPVGRGNVASALKEELIPTK